MGHYILAGDGTFIVERRMAPRYEVAMSVRLGIVEAESDSIGGIATNISEWGVQVLVPTSVADGTTIDFSCPYFRGTAETVWSRREGAQVRMGMKFLSMPGVERLKLRELLGNLARERSAWVSSRLPPAVEAA